MSVPDWAKARVCESLDKAPPVEHGKIILVAELSYSHGGLGSVKTKVTHEECHRPQKEGACKK